MNWKRQKPKFQTVSKMKWMTEFKTWEVSKNNKQQHNWKKEDGKSGKFDMAILINDILTKAYLLILRMNLNIIKY